MATSLNLGCSHYTRKCKFVAPCCQKTYSCRFCHDEKEKHTINRKNVKQVICLGCSRKQPVESSCYYCGLQFGNYYCLECNLFDDEDKGQFHCEGCGICRVGGADNYFHCSTCNMCLELGLLGDHKCIENRSHTDCPVCMEDMHSSRNPLHIPSCGHLLHTSCLEELKKAEHLTCPICKTRFKD